MRHASRLAGTLMLTLAACSGGGSGSSSGGTMVTPPATPTPGPTPSPTPTPTPVASYDLAFDVTRDRDFQLIGAELDSIYAAPITSRVDTAFYDPGALATLRYVAATRLSTLSILNIASDVYANPQGETANGLSYGTVERFFSISRLGPRLGNLRADLDYTVQVRQFTSTPVGDGTQRMVERRFVGGSPTLSSDLPTTGTSRYTVLLYQMGETAGASEPLGLSAISGTLTVDFAARTVTASAVTAPGNPAVTIRFTGGFVGETGQIRGTLTTSDGGTGEWGGRLFGPRGREAGIAYRFARGSAKAIGTVAGAVDP